MDPTRRDALLERRRLEQLRRRRRELSAGYRRVALALCAQGVRASKLMPPRNEAVLGPLAAGPSQDEELDFAWMGNARIAAWETSAERDALCRAALTVLTAPADRIAIIWHPARAGLSIRSADLLAHLPLVLDEGNGDTTWIAAARAGPWLVQIGFWSRTLSWSPSVPLSA
jgi:hypothetical protein